MKDLTVEQDGNTGQQVDPEPEPAKKRSKKRRLRAELDRERQRARTWRLRALAGLVVAGLLLVAVAGLTWSRVAIGSEIDDIRATASADSERRAAATAAAEEYVTKSLTIDFENAEAYVKSLAEGTTPAFGKTFDLSEGEAGGLTLELIRQLRMKSEGEVAYTMFEGDPESLPADGEPWNFVVVATQTATTVQQPEPSTSAVILRVVVVHLDGQWLISSFAPDPKVQTGEDSPVPGAN
ncbi:hypothetical protein [Gordonia hirsuta]|uniref:hypothetical protein n=1 Tax=Gordonia hirsuta TaxID=53427 RepID=UPI0012DC9432|nr:hypothetical protein [Gordonia hirsuta]